MSLTRKIGDLSERDLPDSLKKLMEFERFHIYRPDFFQDYHGLVATKYLPQNSEVIELPGYWISRRRLGVYESPVGALLALGLSEGSDRDERLLFPIHPSSLPHYARFLDAVQATPASVTGLRLNALSTSSPRTLLVWPEENFERAFFAKTTFLLDPPHGNWRLHAKRVGYCVGITRVVADTLDSYSDTISYFPECAALIPRTMADSGSIIRAIPGEIMDGRIVVAPLFSLLGGTGSYRPLLLTLADEHRINLREFVETTLCAQFARVWLRLSMGAGLFMEPHGQNLMLALLPDMTPINRFYYKDFDGITVDWELRRALGFKEPLDMPRAFSWDETYSAMFAAPYWRLSWLKMRVSLYAYLHFFLSELNVCLQAWQSIGLVAGAPIADDELTMSFSRYMIKSLNEEYGTRISAEYNIYRNLNRFLPSLLHVRHDILGDAAKPTALG